LTAACVAVCLLGCRSRCEQSAEDIYRRVAPSIAFLRTPVATGSGVLLEGGYVLTNAHVAWPYLEVRVVFPGGEEFAQAPVVALDIDSDLALVGPLSVNLPPLKFSQGELAAIGSPVYLVGYPAEVDDFPKPALTAGVVSRIRESRFKDLTFLQADATIVGGQSGGALVSAKGEVVGISGLTGLGNFALVLASADVQDIVENLRARKQPIERPWSLGAPNTSHSFQIREKWGQQSFVVELRAGEKFSIARDAESQVDLSTFDPAGVFIEPTDDGDDDTAGDDDAKIEFEAEIDGPHFVVARPKAAVSSKALGAGAPVIELLATAPISSLGDPDDNRPIKVGETTHGVIDTPSDRDTYPVHLEAAQRIRVRVDGLLDVQAAIDLPELAGEPLAIAKPAEGGLGLSAELTFTAPRAGEYLLIVEQTATDQGPAGYDMSVLPDTAHEQQAIHSVFGAPR
jgi:S1-C subfamily serine protease